MTILPTGQQFLIESGRYAAVVTEVGATLRSFTVDGAETLYTFAEDEPAGSKGRQLVPWPNRIRDGRYTYELTLAPTTAAVRPDDATPVAANPVGASSAAGPRGAMLAGNVSVAGGAFVLPPALLPPGEGETADGPAAAGGLWRPARTGTVQVSPAGDRLAFITVNGE